MDLGGRMEGIVVSVTSGKVWNRERRECVDTVMLSYSLCAVPILYILKSVKF